MISTPCPSSRFIAVNFCALIGLLTAVGCIRYVPSRAELSKTEDGSLIRSEEEFFKDEKLQKSRLAALLTERAKNADQNGAASYKIGVGDLVDVNVFDVAELKRTVRVQPGGVISLPLINTVQAEGKTELELQLELQKQLEKYINAPQVNVFILEYAAHKVSVIGEVSKPGMYSLKRDDYTLMEVLSESGGKTEKAGSYIVLIPAAKPRLPEEARGSLTTAANQVAAVVQDRAGIEIPFDELVGSAGKAPINVVLASGDTIVVPEAGMVQVDGEVLKPGSFVLGSKMTLLGAIAAGSSVTYSADVKNVEVIRETGPGRKAVLTVDLEQIALGSGKDVRLRDGDVVRVPSDGGRFVTRQMVEAVRGIINVGVTR